MPTQYQRTIGGARKYKNEKDWCDFCISSDSLKSVSEIINHKLQNSAIYAMIVKVKCVIQDKPLWFGAES